jgi:hypothetical protein
MFAVIRHYHFDKKDSAEIDRLIPEQFVAKLLRQKPEVIEGPIKAHD